MANNFTGLDKRRLFVIVCCKTSFIEQASQSQSLLLNLDIRDCIDADNTTTQFLNVILRSASSVSEFIRLSRRLFKY